MTSDRAVPDKTVDTTEGQRMLMLAKAHHVALEIHDGFDPEEGEKIEVGYWVGEDDSFDAIRIDDDLNENWPVLVALDVAKMIGKVHAWSKTKAGQKEIARIRGIVRKKSGCEE